MSPLESPNWRYTPDRRPVEKILRRDDILAHIFDHVKAAAEGWEPLTFNPRPRLASPTRGGRFDAYARADRYSTLYVAETKDGGALAAWETILRKATPPKPGGKWMMSEAEFRSKSLVYCTPLAPLRLVDVTDAAGMSVFGTHQSLSDADDYHLPRVWARYIRRFSHDFHGLAYRSRQYGNGDIGDCIVLFGDRCDKNVFHHDEPIDLSVGYGKNIIQGLLERLDIGYY